MTRAPLAFDPMTSTRTLSVGLSDASEIWLLPQLLAKMSTAADEMPADIERAPLFRGGFVCLFDPAQTKVAKKISLEKYLAHDHVIVSYNGDLRGVVEDLVKIQRRVRVSVPSFHAVGMASLPFAMEGTWSEMLWRRADQDDDAHQLIRQMISACSSPHRSDRRSSAP